jgi:endo-1,4-beta-xylanase
MKNILLAFSLFITLISKGQEQYLKDQVHFPLGASLNPRLLENKPNYRTRAISEFNSVTAENHMKMMLVHPEQNRFDFSK